MTNSKYSFERTELRALQNSVDNEEFLKLVSEMIGSRNDEIESLNRSIETYLHREYLKYQSRIFD